MYYPYKRKKDGVFGILETFVLVTKSGNWLSMRPEVTEIQNQLTDWKDCHIEVWTFERRETGDRQIRTETIEEYNKRRGIKSPEKAVL